MIYFKDKETNELRILESEGMDEHLVVQSHGELKRSIESAMKLKVKGAILTTIK